MNTVLFLSPAHLNNQVIRRLFDGWKALATERCLVWNRHQRMLVLLTLTV